MEPRIHVDNLAAGRAVERIDADVRREVHNAIMRVGHELARGVRRNAPKAFSGLVNSIRTEEIAEMHARVVVGADYARAVEDGRRPGKQPGTSNGLMEWVRQKTGAVGDSLDRITFLVARAIGRRGIKPTHFVQRAFDDQRERIIANIRAAARRGATGAAHA